jgi:phosphatidylinositol-3-phosphatase
MSIFPQFLSDRRVGGRILLLGLLAVAFGAVGVPAQGSAPLGATTAHLAVIVMENKEFSDVIGNPNASYLNETLVPNGKLFTNYFAVTHPSLPNYVALTAGTMAGCVADNCGPESIPTENVFHQMNGAFISWNVYAESMPSNCYPHDFGAYLVRHNPAPYYANLGPQGDGTCLTNNVPYEDLAGDLAAGTLPQFLFISPNQYNDMHTDQTTEPCLLGSETDDEVCQGDVWLRENLPSLLSNNGQNDVTAIIVFDEGRTFQGGGGHIFVLEVGPNVCQGCVSVKMFTHYGLLEAIDRWFGLPPLVPRLPDL